MFTLATIGLIGSLVPLLAIKPEPLPLLANIDVSYQIAGNGAAVMANQGIPQYWTPSQVKPKAVHYRLVTAYSSTPEQTDDSPFITASGNHVRVGTAAANWLPFGTAIRIPELFGDRIFIVEDRMHARHDDKVDIWFPEKQTAKKFGIRLARIEVL